MRNLPAAKISRLFCLGLAFLLPIQPCFSADYIPMSWTAEEAYQQASSFYQNGNNQGALDACNAAIAKDANHWRALQLAGYASYKLGNAASAADYYRKSLKLHPDNPALLTFLDKLPITPEPRADLPEGLRNPGEQSSSPSLGTTNAEVKKGDPDLLKGILIGAGVILVVITIVSIQKDGIW